MADSYTENLRLRLLEQDANIGTWGPLLNAGFWQLLEDSISGQAIVDVTAGNVVLTKFNGATDEARCAIIKATGTPGITRIVEAPVADSKIYLMENATSDNSNITFRVAGGDPGVTVLPGTIVLTMYEDIGNTMKLVGSTSTLVTAGTATTSAVVTILNGAAAATTTFRYFTQGSLAIGTLVGHTSTISTNDWRIVTSALIPSALWPNSPTGVGGVVIEAGVERRCWMYLTASGDLFLRPILTAFPGTTFWTPASTRTLPFDWTFTWVVPS